MMKNIFIVLFVLIVSTANGQSVYNTGSTQLDADLVAINTSASANVSTFKANLSLSYDVEEKKIDFMIGTLKMQLGEIYFALEIAKVSQSSVDEVINIYKVHKNKGWGYIAKQAGIKPGSSEFHQLKNNASTNNKSAKGNGQGKGNGKSKAGKN